MGSADAAHRRHPFDLLLGNGKAVVVKHPHIGSVGALALLLLLCKGRFQSRTFGVDVIAQHMHLRDPLGGKLNRRHHLHAKTLSLCHGAGKSVGGIVVGQRNGGKPCLLGGKNQLLGGHRAVGKKRMGVQIDPFHSILVLSIDLPCSAYSVQAIFSHFNYKPFFLLVKKGARIFQMFICSSHL